MSKRDFYEVLGVAKDASEDDIRRAYKKAAVKYHPDRNPDDQEAETKFKEATEAYTVLQDAEKRRLYDQFGHSGLEGQAGFDFQGAGIGDILSQFQDMFSDFFGGMGGGFQGQRQRRQARGQDIRVEVRIPFHEAFTGVKREVVVRGHAPCDTCSGSGSKPGTHPETCRQCNGQGQVATQRGFIMFSTTCPVCRGRGQVITNPCETCDGAGLVDKERKVLVTFPAGVDSGVRMRVGGQGMPGPDGAMPGDLYVDVEVEGDERFEREGEELITRETLEFAEAALGTTLDVELPDEEKVEVEVPAGTQPGTVISVKKKGFPSLDRRARRGQLHVVVNVRVPKKLSRRAKKLLNELDQELNGKRKAV